MVWGFQYTQPASSTVWQHWLGMANPKPTSYEIFKIFCLTDFSLNWLIPSAERNPTMERLWIRFLHCSMLLCLRRYLFANFRYPLSSFVFQFLSLAIKGIDLGQLPTGFVVRSDLDSLQRSFLQFNSSVTLCNKQNIATNEV